MSEVKWKWRDHYMRRARESGEKHPGCGPEEAHPKEIRLASKLKRSRCSVCGGPIYRGDWIRWNKETRAVRHAPYGFRTRPEEDALPDANPAVRTFGMGLD